MLRIFRAQSFVISSTIEQIDRSRQQGVSSYQRCDKEEGIAALESGPSKRAETGLTVSDCREFMHLLQSIVSGLKFGDCLKRSKAFECKVQGIASSGGHGDPSDLILWLQQPEQTLVQHSQLPLHQHLSAGVSAASVGCKPSFAWQSIWCFC